MEKYVTNIKDLVIQTLTNGSEIKAKAESGDALSCFQMGMIHLLGINTSINFKKASQYLGNQSLADNVNANRILGFIAECEGNYSMAFKKYANAATGSKSKKPYINKVFSERNDFNAYLKKLGFSGSLLNKEITALLNDYIKGGDTKLDASIKLAMICEDEDSCIDAAQSLFDSGDFHSAMRWLKKGNISENITLYSSVKEKISDFRNALNLSATLEVLELDGESLLTDMTTAPSYEGIKEICDDAAAACKKEWNEIVSPQISAIKKEIKDAEAARAKKEKDAEAARLKKQKDAEFEAFKKSLFEKAAREKKRRNIFLIVVAVIVVMFIAVVASSSDEKDNSDKVVNKEVVVSDNSDENSNEVSRSEAREENKRKEESSSTYLESDNSGYDNVLSERRLSDDDLADKTKKELEIMRNSIYARYGYKFKREDLLNHFSQYSWYNPTTSDMGAIYNMMNDNEKFNVDFIKTHE